LRRFILIWRRFKFSLQSVQLVVKLGQLSLLDLQLRGELGLNLFQPRFLLSKRPQPGLDAYEFGPYRLDPVNRVLLRDGRPVVLTPKMFEILLLLIKHRGQVVEKEEIMRTVWPDVFVEEGNLTVNISGLRKALGQVLGGRDYIETIQRRGYRFEAPGEREKNNQANYPEPEIYEESSAANRGNSPHSTKRYPLAVAVGLRISGACGERNVSRTNLFHQVLDGGFHNAPLNARHHPRPRTTCEACCRSVWRMTGFRRLI
jgi:DNA-binding winged helix-turn-helix (wHTH) protein